ncbi:hypothetical protein Pla110_24290 [Polystyrenella longa]|uniref:Uncharacterized protein n=1 Tax=Polystyrenella longa TaxID=2528007 RepID=A0A518CNA0_9PLAN|nr:hypothetical protein [Polystyrenella longa]QDU80697.1 hypothetical protein Pla110_24290 [Polystyrenella longa]
MTDNTLDKLSDSFIEFSSIVSGFQEQLADSIDDDRAPFVRRDNLIKVMKDYFKYYDKSDGVESLSESAIENIPDGKIKNAAFSLHNKDGVTAEEMLAFFTIEVSKLPIWENEHSVHNFLKVSREPGNAAKHITQFVLRSTNPDIPSLCDVPVSKARQLIEDSFPGNKGGKIRQAIRDVKRSALLLPAGSYVIELMDEFRSCFDDFTHQIYATCMNREFQGYMKMESWPRLTEVAGNLASSGITVQSSDSVQRLDRTFNQGEPAAGYRSAYFQKVLGITSDTVRNWAKAAGVKTPTRADDSINWRYSAEEAVKLLDTGIKRTPSEDIRELTIGLRDEIFERLDVQNSD